MEILYKIDSDLDLGLCILFHYDISEFVRLQLSPSKSVKVASKVERYSSNKWRKEIKIDVQEQC